MPSTRRNFLKTVATGAAALSLKPAEGRADLAWPKGVTRPWVGPVFWANRLQDWRVRDGRLECVRAGADYPMRTVHLLTRRLGPKEGDLVLEVRTGLEADGNVSADTATGFLVGVGPSMDYRGAALVHHNPGPGGGLFAGIDAAGQAFLRDFTAAGPAKPAAARKPAMPAEVVLRLTAKPAGGKVTLTLTASDAAGKAISQASKDVAAEALAGNIALVSHPGSGKATGRAWFRDLKVSGSKVETHADRACGPILCTQYTVHNGTLKLTAQLMPLGKEDNLDAELQVQDGKDWKTVAKAKINPLGWTAAFRVADWDTKRDVLYRVLYQLKVGDGKTETHAWAGVIKHDPVEKQSLVVASLSCVQQVNGRIDAGKSYNYGQVWFPHADLVPNVARHQPDLLFFAGDQIYEGNPTRVVRQPTDEAHLDYLYKWYLWCWAYRDLTKDIPTITIPDDHDVYHGNIWGMGGQAARPGDPGGLLGGYAMSADWLNMMQRTQTSHLPDPFDPRPVEQGVEVYFTSLVWGQVGFAILEDRKFKSSPTVIGKVRMTPDSHILEKDYDTRKADVPGATLLGERQHKFLEAFAQDWTGQLMKAALSQTIFCNLQISSRGETAGQLDKDLDSNGWPQSGRRRALELMRQGFMIHLAGDQHLASVIHHGLDDWQDAGWSFCSPAVANLYTRFWNPDYPPADGKPGPNPFAGRYEDGFHNKLTVHAVANPVDKPRPGQFPEPVELHRKAPGYAIVRFDKSKRTITLECWPRYPDPTNPKTGGQYPGWPIIVKQEDQYGRKPAAYLPTLQVAGLADPVVQVIDEKDGQVVYTLRIQGATYRPKVFRPGSYTVKVGEPGTPKLKELKQVASLKEGEEKEMKVEL